MIEQNYESKSCIDMIEELKKTVYKTHNSDNCDDCKHLGKYENEIEYGCSCPCLRCKRRCPDNYESE